MTFCRWYPLLDAAAHAPARPGVLQLRVVQGLVEYPRGKSAMVHYALADDMSEAAGELASQFRGHELLCRHTETLASAEASALVSAFESLLERFRARFGTEPRFLS